MSRQEDRQAASVYPPGNAKAVVPSGAHISPHLAQKQAEFESLLKIQGERRAKEEAVRRGEERFAIREEKILREAHALAVAKAAFHAERISWKRAQEDALRREEDARRAVEDARRKEEDKRRAAEDLAQMELDHAVRQVYEQTSLIDAVEKERMQRWIEEDRVRALEDILLQQDVLDLTLHARLRTHVHNNFDRLIGFAAASKADVDAQVDALLDALFDSAVNSPPLAVPAVQPSPVRATSLPNNAVQILPPSSAVQGIASSQLPSADLPPAYHVVTKSTASPQSPPYVMTAPSQSGAQAGAQIGNPAPFASTAPATALSATPVKKASVEQQPVVQMQATPPATAKMAIFNNSATASMPAASSGPLSASALAPTAINQPYSSGSPQNSIPPRPINTSHNIEVDDFAVMDFDAESEMDLSSSSTISGSAAQQAQATGPASRSNSGNLKSPAQPPPTSSSSGISPSSSSTSLSSTLPLPASLLSSLRGAAAKPFFDSSSATSSPLSAAPSSSVDMASTGISSVSSKERGPVASDLSMEMDDDLDFDLSIEATSPLVFNDDWEMVSKRSGVELRLSASMEKAQKAPQEEGIVTSHTERFLALRTEHIKDFTQQISKQYSKIMAEATLMEVLDPKLVSNPFSKLVLSTRDTWDSCDQCGTYFDRMSIKHTCKICFGKFCSKCELKERYLDLAVLTSRIPDSSVQLRALIPKTKEAMHVEVRCCQNCDVTLTYLAARDARSEISPKSAFFTRLYRKSLAARVQVQEALLHLDQGIEQGRSSQELDEVEGTLLSALRRFQSSLDSFDHTIASLRNQLPLNPKTGQRFTSSTEIRCLSMIKSDLANFFLENKKLLAHHKILRQSRQLANLPHPESSS